MAAPPDRRAAVVAEVARRVTAVDLEHPTRVCIDGITGSGKTTLADELGVEVGALGRPVVRLTMDGYHHPRAHRHRQGRESAAGYYEDAYDFGAFATNVLEPLGPDGDRRYRAAVIDLPTDEPVDDPSVEVAPDTVLVVDGSFLQRAELRDQWDLCVYLDVDFAVARARGAARDAELLGSRRRAEHLFDVRYHAAARRYLAEVDPRARADVVIDNDDPPRARIRR
jgi:uridine kinase